MKAGSRVLAGGVDHLDPRGRVEALADRRDAAVAHEHVEPAVDALAGVEHARAAHEHVGRGCVGLHEAACVASAHAAASPPASTS